MDRHMIHLTPPEKPAWPGPVAGGMTQSLINDWLAAGPYGAYLRFVLGLKDHRPKEPNLVWGDTFHVALEHLVSGEDLDVAKDRAITYMYEEYDLTEIEYTWERSICNMLDLYYQQIPGDFDWHTEQPVDIPYKLPSGTEIRMRGKVDGVHWPTKSLLEHKCKGRIDVETMWTEIPWDFQINLYAYATGLDNVYYDVIKVPDTQFMFPQVPINQSPRDFIDEIYYGPIKKKSNRYPIATYKDDYIYQKGPIPLNNIDTVLKWQIEPLCQNIVNWWEMVTDPSFDPNNPSPDFFMKPVRHFDPAETGSYKCRYHGLLTQTQDICELDTITNFYPELPNE